MNRYSTKDDVDLRDAQDLDRILSEADLQERADFAQGVRSSPLRIEEFLLDHVISVELVGLDANREFDLERLIEEVTRANRGSQVSSGAPRY